MWHVFFTFKDEKQPVVLKEHDQHLEKGTACPPSAKQRFERRK